MRRRWTGQREVGCSGSSMGYSALISSSSPMDLPGSSYLSLPSVYELDKITFPRLFLASATAAKRGTFR